MLTAIKIDGVEVGISLDQNTVDVSGTLPGDISINFVTENGIDYVQVSLICSAAHQIDLIYTSFVTVQ